MDLFITGVTGFIGGSLATALLRDGHTVRGLVRSTDAATRVEALGIVPVLGTLEDRELLTPEAQRAHAVINAASSDHRGAVEALLDGLRGSGKAFLHTSGSTTWLAMRCRRTSSTRTRR